MTDTKEAEPYVAALLAEVHADPQVRATPTGFRLNLSIPPEVSRKARLLARMKVSGPSSLCVCELHDLRFRSDLWRKCGKVTVAEALLGTRTDCGS